MTDLLTSPDQGPNGHELYPDIEHLALEFPVTCPSGGHPLRVVQRADPKGWSGRERRVVVQCAIPHCSRTYVVEVHLIDVVGDTATNRRQREHRARTEAVA